MLAYERGYRISEQGLCFNKSGKQVGGYTNNTGYLAFSLRVDKIPKRVNIHRLQAFQKYGHKLYEKGIMVRHLNGIKTDNSWDNIAIGTNSQNQMDIPEQIRIKRALHATSFVRKHDKEIIREYHKHDNSYKKTMAQFDISSKGTLHFILNK